jgi:hypothetical protein
MFVPAGARKNLLKLGITAAKNAEWIVECKGYASSGNSSQL